MYFNETFKFKCKIWRNWLFFYFEVNYLSLTINSKMWQKSSAIRLVLLGMIYTWSYINNSYWLFSFTNLFLVSSLRIFYCIEERLLLIWTFFNFISCVILQGHNFLALQASWRCLFRKSKWTLYEIWNQILRVFFLLLKKKIYKLFLSYTKNATHLGTAQVICFV